MDSFIPVAPGEGLQSFVRTRLFGAGVSQVRINEALPTPRGELREHVVRDSRLTVNITHPSPQSPRELAELCEQYGSTLQCIGVVRVSSDDGEDHDFAVVATDRDACNRCLVHRDHLGPHSKIFVDTSMTSAWNMQRNAVPQRVVTKQK